MLILALDTTTRAGSAALVRDSAVIQMLSGDPSVMHAQRLPGDLMRLIDTAGVPLNQLHLLAVAAGPGSFTGLRVGIATMQGVAIAGGLQIVPVSTLEALAYEGAREAQPDEYVAPWIDAQRGEVFAALYQPGAAAPHAPPSSLTAAATLEQWAPMLGSNQVLFIGDGAARYRDVIAARCGPRARVLDHRPLAPAIGLIAAAHPERAVAPHAVIPIYVRRPDAVLAKERRGTA